MSQRVFVVQGVLQQQAVLRHSAMFELLILRPSYLRHTRTTHIIIVIPVRSTLRPWRRFSFTYPPEVSTMMYDVYDGTCAFSAYNTWCIHTWPFGYPQKTSTGDFALQRVRSPSRGRWVFGGHEFSPSRAGCFFSNPLEALVVFLASSVYFPQPARGPRDVFVPVEGNKNGNPLAAFMLFALEEADVEFSKS